MRILNLYAGIGGNRKLWPKVWDGEEVKVTAVEINPDIAKIYKDFFPDDEVIVGDAHQYLLEHYKEFDFIWSSPPCPTHSRFMFLKVHQGVKPRYFDMRLWQEIIFLMQYAECNWVVENVRISYEPFINPFEIGRHYFWSNIILPKAKIDTKKIRNYKGRTLDKRMNEHGFIIENFYNYNEDKRTLLANCVEPELGLHIFNCAFKEKQEVLLNENY